MSKSSRLVISAALALLLSVSTALASEASDAYKEAKKRVDAAASAETDEAQAAQLAEVQAWVKSRAASLLGSDGIGRMDIGYVGRMQSEAHLYDEAIVTLEKALADPRKTSNESYIRLFHIQALIGAEQYDKAFTAFEKMAADFESEKTTKIAAKEVGSAMRSQRRWKESVVALDYALKAKDAGSLKPLVNSLMLEGRRDEAIAAIEYAIEKAGTKGADDSHPILMQMVKAWGQPVTLDFDAFAPGPAPDLTGKVVVMGFWNTGAGSMAWTMGTLTRLFESYPPVDGVEVLAATRYYQKNPDTGKIEEGLTPEAERQHGLAYRETHNFPGQLAYMKSLESMEALGVSALPHIVVIGKDGKLLYSHTIDRRDPTEVDVIADIIKKAAGK